MISETAMQALQVRSGIETCKFNTSADWKTIIDRIIYDLDAAGDAFGIEIVNGILREAWAGLSDRPGMDARLAGRVSQASEEDS